MSSGSNTPQYNSGIARAIAARSMPALIRLNALPRWFVVVGLGALMVGGLILENRIGGLLLLIVTAFVGWLLLLSWPVLNRSARTVRALVVLVLAGLSLYYLIKG
ncbi:unannotated protein [freshwater metagenome]|uniref:Unannotated protein n=1 Tax=freshwater metagenome TaxID=449393 RepID=A0A6J7DLI1_9ZZZZ|nr:hypothetical protein [Actinomycetota bacterium]